MKRKRIQCVETAALTLTGVATLFALTACGGGAAAPSADLNATLDPANPTIVKVGASPVPHSQILQYINENLARRPASIWTSQRWTTTRPRTWR